MKNNNVKFQKLMQKLRKKSGLSLRAIQTMTGISNSYLSQIEKGTRGIPKIDVLYKLSKAYNADLNSIVKTAYLTQGIGINTTNFLHDSYIQLDDTDKKFLKDFVKFLIDKKEIEE